MTLIIVALIFTAVPLSFDPETLAGVLPITIGAVLFLILGELIVNRKRDK